MRFLRIFAVLLCVSYVVPASANSLYEYMFSIMMMVGGSTTCKEVMANPQGAKQSINMVIDRLNGMSPNNQLDASFANIKIDAVINYCAAHPDDLLVNALMKASSATSSSPVTSNKSSSATRSHDSNRSFSSKNSGRSSGVNNYNSFKKYNGNNNIKNKEKTKFIN